MTDTDTDTEVEAIAIELSDTWGDIYKRAATVLRRQAAEIERLEKALTYDDVEYSAEQYRQLRNKHDAAMAEIEQLRAAAKAFEANLSEYCDGPERDALRAALDRANDPTVDAPQKQ